MVPSFEMRRAKNYSTVLCAFERAATEPEATMQSKNKHVDMLKLKQQKAAVVFGASIHLIES